jgi:hypothetical protein
MAATTTGPPAPDAAALRREADATMDASVAASRRMVALADDSRQSGARTLNMLDNQGGPWPLRTTRAGGVGRTSLALTRAHACAHTYVHKYIHTRTTARIARLDGNVDAVQGNLDASRRQLTIFERAQRCCGLGGFCAGGGGDDDNNARRAHELQAVPTTTTQQPKSSPGASAGAGGKVAASAAAMPRLADDAREDELAGNLDVVGDILADLRLQSAQMAGTLDDQNAALDRLNAKTDDTLSTAAHVNQRAAKLV